MKPNVKPLVYLKTDITSRVKNILKNAQGEEIEDEKESTYEFILNFDKLDSLTIDENLQVCTSDTIRGRNKTFNAYKKPNSISITAKFSDLQTTNVIITGDFPNLEQTDYEVVRRINPAVGKKKSDYLNKLFTLMTDNSLLTSVCTFYKTYDNYIINNFSLTYSNNSVIEVQLTLQEVLLRDLGETQGLSFSQIRELSAQEVDKLNKVLETLNKRAQR